MGARGIPLPGVTPQMANPASADIPCGFVAGVAGRKATGSAGAAESCGNAGAEAEVEATTEGG